MSTLTVTGLRPENDEDLLNKIKEHAKSAHNFEEIPPKLYEKVRDAIK